MAANPFAYEGPPLPSPSNRFQVVPGTGPVTYACPLSAAGALTRYTGYGFSTAQAPPTSSSSATGLLNATCEVDYSPNVMGRTGILFVRVNATDANLGETVSVFREIHVDNSP